MALYDHSGSADPQDGSNAENVGNQAKSERSRNNRVGDLLSHIKEHAWRGYLQRKRRD